MALAERVGRTVRPDRAWIGTWWSEQDEAARSEAHHAAWPELRSELVFDVLAHWAALDLNVLVNTFARDFANAYVLSEVSRLQAEAERDPVPIVTLAALHELAPDWRLVLPLQVTVEAYGDHVIARIPELGAYGEGASEQDALEDLRANVVELSDDLTEGEAGSELAQRWHRLVTRAQIGST